MNSNNSNNVKIKAEDNHIYKRHNKSLLLYHLVLVIKYRKKIITEDIEYDIKNICLKIENVYYVKQLEFDFMNDEIK
jgi:REP element-mobilizing transposase RayT